MHSSKPITYERLIPSLLERIPEFQPDSVDVDERITYLVFDEFVNFLLERDPKKESVLLQRGFGFLEELSASHEREVRMLLRDIAWAIAGNHNVAAVLPILPPQLLNLVKKSPAGKGLS